jgi:hypothetical protein
MSDIQGELFILQLPRERFRLRANDIIRINGDLGRVLRVNECAAVVMVNRRTREFVTRFDKHVKLRPSPVIFRIAANSETEIFNRKTKRKPRKEKA